MQRRQLLKFVPAAAASTIIFTPAPAAPPTTYTLHDYYAFLWLEMERVEQLMQIDRLNCRSLEKGRHAAELFLTRTNIVDRLNALASVTPEAATAG